MHRFGTDWAASDSTAVGLVENFTWTNDDLPELGGDTPLGRAGEAVRQCCEPGASRELAEERPERGARRVHRAVGPREVP
mgnify:CR=1 FL=1